MSTGTLAATAGYSVQQVRDLEALGVIPGARRARNGYRCFDQTHGRDLRAYRDLATAVGPVMARRVLREIRVLPRAGAVQWIGSLHAGLNRDREQALEARSALLAIGAEASTDAEPDDADSMTITELSQALGVRPSALRFWESVGLVTPARAGTRPGSARRYHVSAVRAARVTHALRSGGYRIPEVQRAVTALEDLQEVGDSLQALDAHLDAINQRALALLRAGATLAAIIEAADRP